MTLEEILERKFWEVYVARHGEYPNWLETDAAVESAMNVLDIFKYTIDENKNVQEVSMREYEKNHFAFGVRAADGKLWEVNDEFPEELTETLERANCCLEENDSNRMRELLQKYCNFEVDGFGVTHISLKED